MLNEYIIEKTVKRGFDEVKPIFDLIQGSGFIAGSYAAWMSVLEPRYEPADIDIFVTSEEAIAPTCFALRHLGYHGNGGSEITANFAHDTGKPVQVIKPDANWKAFPDDILQSFDLDICRAVLLSPEKVLADVNAGSGCATVLRINSPMRVLKRVLKYHRRGVEFADADLIKLFLAWDDMSEDQKARVIGQAIPDDVPPPDYDFDWDEHFFSE